MDEISINKIRWLHRTPTVRRGASHRAGAISAELCHQKFQKQILIRESPQDENLLTVFQLIYDLFQAHSSMETGSRRYLSCSCIFIGRILAKEPFDCAQLGNSNVNSRKSISRCEVLAVVLCACFFKDSDRINWFKSNWIE